MIKELKNKIEEIDNGCYKRLLPEENQSPSCPRCLEKRKAILNSYKDIAEEELEFLENIFNLWCNGKPIENRIVELKQVIEYCKEELK